MRLTLPAQPRPRTRMSSKSSNFAASVFFCRIANMGEAFEASTWVRELLFELADHNTQRTGETALLIE